MRAMRLAGLPESIEEKEPFEIDWYRDPDPTDCERVDGLADWIPYVLVWANSSEQFVQLQTAEGRSLARKLERLDRAIKPMLFQALEYGFLNTENPPTLPVGDEAKHWLINIATAFYPSNDMYRLCFGADGFSRAILHDLVKAGYTAAAFDLGKCMVPLHGKAAEKMQSFWVKGVIHAASKAWLAQPYFFQEVSPGAELSEIALNYVRSLDIVRRHAALDFCVRLRLRFVLDDQPFGPREVVKREEVDRMVVTYKDACLSSLHTMNRFLR